MGQNFNATNSGQAQAVMDDLLENANTLRSSFSGAAAPSAPVEGQLHEHTDGSTSGYDVLRLYSDPDGAGDGWHEVGAYLHESLQSVDGNHQLVGWRAENTGTAPTPAAGNVGRFALDTSGPANRLKLVRNDATLDTVMHGNSAEFIRDRLAIGACELDATNPPTAVAVGTSPTIRGMLFDATNEKVSGSFQVPDGYSAAHDLFVEVACYLSAAETASDTIDAKLDYVCTTPNQNETATKTSTQSTIAHSIGANNAQYSSHTFRFTIDFDDANNPVAAGDIIDFEFALSSVASVAAIIVRSLALLSPFGGTTLET